MHDPSMIKEGDHVLVGISGGKDSMILLQTLAERLAAIPFNFQISPSFPNHRTRPGKKPAKSTCFICSWTRRKELFSLTKDLDCNKLALGHHRNDA